MAAPTAITSLTNVAASNGPDGATELPSVLDDYQRAHAALFKRSLSIGGSISATATLAVPDDYGYVEVMGSGEIVAIDDSKSWDGREVTLRFSAATTLSHSTNLALPLGQQLVTEAGGFAKFIRRTVGVWECVSYERRAAGPQVFSTIDVRGQASFSGTMNVGGPITAASTLDVRAQASFSASVNVGGALLAASTLDARAQASFSATLIAGGPLFARGTFDVSGNASFSASLIVGGSLDVHGPASFSGSLMVGNNLNVAGPTSLSASLNVGGPTLLGNRLDVRGSASFSATISALRIVVTGEVVAASFSGNNIVLQRAYQEYVDNADLTTAIPADDTIPQITEGTEILSQAFTPKSASSLIRCRFQAQGANSTNGTAATVGLFKEGTASAISAAIVSTPTANVIVSIVLEHEEASGSTAARTYKVRVGPNANTLRLNGTPGGRLLGGVSRSTIVIEEVI